MPFLERLPLWLRLARPSDAANPQRADGAAKAVNEPSSPRDGLDDDAALDAVVMCRRVRHFCEERPPAQRTRRR